MEESSRLVRRMPAEPGERDEMDVLKEWMEISFLGGTRSLPAGDGCSGGGPVENSRRIDRARRVAPFPGPDEETDAARFGCLRGSFWSALVGAIGEAETYCVQFMSKPCGL